MQIAIKTINKSHMSSEELLALQNEVSLMQQVDHPNIVKYYETYEDKKFIYLCMELMTGGELIQKGHKNTEAEAAFYFARVVKAIQHCNAQDIVHRDIKPLASY